LTKPSPILSSNDKGESPTNGALLVAPYGKGYYIYTGLSLFRELPEGAWRLPPLSNDFVESTNVCSCKSLKN
jgi:hypothetical protein